MTTTNSTTAVESGHFAEGRAEAAAPLAPPAPTDAQRLEALYAREQRQNLTKQEIAEVTFLARREAARKLLDAVYHAAGSARDVEARLHALWDGRSVATSPDPTVQAIGYAIGLRAILKAPEALQATVQLLYDELLKTDEDVRRIVRALGAQEEHTPQGEAAYVAMRHRLCDDIDDIMRAHRAGDLPQQEGSTPPA